jgi:hypothetical protein
MKLILLFCGVLLLVMMAWALESPDATPVEGTDAAAGTESLDSLGLIPSAPDASSPDGGRNPLERTVFRREQPIAYHAAGHRDPFRALLVDSKKDGDIHTDLLLMDGATLTGVVWSNQKYLAMVKDKDGTSFFLREGDPIYRGRVVEITQAQAVFEVSSFGDYDRITLKVRK